MEPSDAELGLQTTASRNFYDLIIFGAGPALLSDTFYPTKEISTLLVDWSEVSGQAVVTQLIEDYPKLSGSIDGAQLTKRMKEQAINFGV